MTQEVQELLQKALALTENERAELAGNLISGLDATVDQDVDAAWQQEVVRRLHEVQSGEVKTVPWEEVRRKGRTLLAWRVSRFGLIPKRNANTSHL
jgi:putative addiction module component (TIGR02574 family)